MADKICQLSWNELWNLFDFCICHLWSTRTLASQASSLQATVGLSYITGLLPKSISWWKYCCFFIVHTSISTWAYTNIFVHIDEDCEPIRRPRWSISSAGMIQFHLQREQGMITWWGCIWSVHPQLQPAWEVNNAACIFPPQCRLVSGPQQGLYPGIIKGKIINGLDAMR